MDTSHFVVRGSLNKPNRQKKWVKYVFSSFLLETQSCTIKVYTCMHKILAMNPRPKMIWIKKPKGTRGGYDPIQLTSFSSYKGFDNYCICAISFATLASTGATVQLFVILSFKYKFNLFKYQISANQQEAETSANANQHSLRGRRLKGKGTGALGKGVFGARETRGAREEGGRETQGAPFPFHFKRLPRRLTSISHRLFQSRYWNRSVTLPW